MFRDGLTSDCFISPIFSREKIWARILHGHSEGTSLHPFRSSYNCPGSDATLPIGHCVLTLGTDMKVDSNLIFERWGRRLLKEHNYAVVGALFARETCVCTDNWIPLDIREVDDQRLLTVLDSRIERRLLEVDDGHLESAGPEPTSSK